MALTFRSIGRRGIDSWRHGCAFAAISALALSACTVGPNYKKPSAPTPESYKEIDGWKPASPVNAASGQAWWSIYQDAVLDGLEKQIDISNQNLKQAEAAYRQAAAIVDEARAGYYPTITAGGGATRSADNLSGSGSSNRVISNQFTASFGASWEPDIWGKIRRTVESNVATAQADAADIASARLSAQATLATDYFELRVDDEMKHLFEETIEAYRHSLEITRNQFNAGTAAQTDVITAETQLEGAESQYINLGVQRSQLEHAIAVLTGKPPSGLTIVPAALDRTIPIPPTGMPSTLLERRPDVSATERQMAASNAQIGVAISAYYPDVTLSASAGFANSVLQNLFNAASTVWSFGPSISETVYDAGLRDAQVAAARAAYDQTVASYRQTVLTAFQQVEDQLAALRILEKQAAVEDTAAKSAHEAVRLTLNQYQQGTVAYTAVITAQTTALTDDESVLNILMNRLVASVTLVDALGGGWSTAQLPNASHIDSSTQSPATDPAAH
ncbi:MAG TPA: efflux transporter outer membrane subunit [Magnetospirillaceae bacterium]